MHTIDPDFIQGIGRISEFGSRKYHMRNFLMVPGMPWSSVYESLLRHLLAFWSGEELDVGPNGEFGETDDPETDMKWSGLPHLLHVAWNVMVLYTYSHREPYQSGDDRPGAIEYTGTEKKWADWKQKFSREQELARAEKPAFMKDPLRAAMVAGNDPTEDPDMTFDVGMGMSTLMEKVEQAGYSASLDVGAGEITLKVKTK